MATWKGTKDDETHFGTKKNDKLWGMGGDDKLFGGAGKDLLDGGKGNDKLFGGDGNDKLIGGSGNDKLYGNDGNDVLTGGKGSDTFIFSKKGSGKDVVTDFDVKKDMLQIAKGTNGIKKPADVLDHAKQVGDNVVINLGDGNKITLKDVKLKDLKKDPGDHFDIG
jgi:Ca2+-binding RTX toxin-like protein